MTSRTAVGLPLHAHRVGRLRGPDDVRVAVALLERPDPGRLGDHDLLPVGGRDVAQHGGEVLRRPVPERVVRAGEHVVVHPVPGELGGHRRVEAGALGVGVVHRDERVGVHRADGRAAGLEDRRAVGPRGGAGDGAVGLVADLDHLDVDAGRPELPEALGGERARRGRLLRTREAGPRLRGRLLAGVRPEVRVVVVDEHGQAGVGRPAADLHAALGVDGAAAVAAALAVERVVPDPDPDRVDPGLGEDVEQVRGSAGRVPEDHAALLQATAPRRRRRRSRTARACSRPGRRRCPPRRVRPPRRRPAPRSW